MTDSEAKVLVDIYNMDIVEKLEFMGIKLRAYQKIFLRMMYDSKKLFNPKRKVMIYDGTRLRCYYGHGKVSKCHYVDERPQG